MGHVSSGHPFFRSPSHCCPQRHAPFESVLGGLIAQLLQRAAECCWKKSGDFPRRSSQVAEMVKWSVTGVQHATTIYNISLKSFKHVPCQYVKKHGLYVLFLHATMRVGWPKKGLGFMPPVAPGVLRFDWSCLFHSERPKFNPVFHDTF